MNKKLISILVVQTLVILSFGLAYISQANYEFMIYLGAVILLSLVVWRSSKKVKYPIGLLWALVFWTFLHLAGGIVPVGDSVLYGWMVIPLSETYPILRFDQLVHAYGFGVTTYLCYVLIKPLLKPKVKTAVALSVVLVMAGLGFGALNEILEFIAVVLAPRTGVGGYINTSLDLVSNLIGAIIALIIIKRGEG